MTTYHPYKVNLSEGQKEKLAIAYKRRCPITIRLSKNQTSGSDELMLTATQINRINKAKSLVTGVEIKISKTQIGKVTVMREGGSLWSAIIPLAKTLAPKLGLAALAGLASEGASQVVKKISGKGQTGGCGGFLIPQDKIKKLIENKHLLTDKQKQEIVSPLQSGGKILIRPTEKQSGGLLGTLLASIGIPLAIEAFKKLTGGRAPQMGRRGGRAPQMGDWKGSRAPRLGMYDPPPPVYGQWGDGTKKRKQKKGKGLLLGKNSPFRDIPLVGAIL